MSTDDEKSSDMMCCASCGIAAVDDVKLKNCDGGCDLVKYCSDECQENHRDRHEEECRKRRAELRDKDLFTMPDESCYGECPLCCLPLPIDPSKSTLMRCCCKMLCNGCHYANSKREYEAGLEQRCAFCREPLPKTEEESFENVTKRIKNNDPVAMREMGKRRLNEGDYETALEYLKKAAELGDAGAHYNLSLMYEDGECVEKDNEKAIHHAEEAAMKDHPGARFYLGCIEGRNDRYERAKKHFIIAANLGDHESLNWLRRLYRDGNASKEDYANALRAYQVAVTATKSAEREKADLFYKLEHAAQRS
jgi:TPR repeat protein